MTFWADYQKDTKEYIERQARIEARLKRKIELEKAIEEKYPEVLEYLELLKRDY